MQTKIHYYYFNTAHDDEREAYKKLCKKLESQGLELSDSISADHRNYYKNLIAPLNGKEIELETTHLFNNQWNTAPTETSDQGLRVFDWAEGIHIHNRNIKEGQYLEQTDEMREIRRNTYKCGYCGAQHQAAKGLVFCDKCLDSEYLEEKDLHLLRLLPVEATRGNREHLTDAEKAHLLPQYIEQQTVATNSRKVKALEKQRENLHKDYEKAVYEATTKRDGFLWLMDRNINIDNCIYYSHTDRFSFGWRKPVSDEVASKLLDIISEFPFNYEIKAQSKTYEAA